MAFETNARIGTLPQTRVRVLRKDGMSELQVGQTIHFREHAWLWGKEMWKKAQRGRITSILNLGYGLICIERL